MHQTHLARLLLVACLAFAIASIFRLLDLQDTSASVACGGLDAFFAGTEPNLTNVVSVKADISSVVPPALCGAEWSDSSIWVLLGSGHLNNGCALAQVGYGRMQGDATIKVFAEYGWDCQNMIPPKIVFDAPAGNHNYMVTYKRPPKLSKRKIHMWFDGQRVAKTNFDPEVKWGELPWDEEWNGETHDEGDDIPGTVNVPAFFANMRHQTCRGCAWEEPVDLWLTSSSNRYAFQWNLSDNFQIWTR
jgi:hypothetical protein